MRRWWVVGLLAAVVGCGSGGGTPSGGAPSGGSGGGAPSGGQSPYGYGPERDGAFTYQPDVVLIDGGPSAIRGVSANGLVWTMDGDAGGVRDLKPGKIMFAASEAAGRVVNIESSGDDRLVTLAPVRLTDIVRDGRITLDRDIDLTSLSFQGAPDLPGAYEESAATAVGANAAVAPVELGAATVELPALLLVSSDNPPDPAAGEYTKKFGEWEVTAYRTAATLGLRADRGLAGEGLKIQLDAELQVNDLHVTTDVPITAGEVGHSGFRVSGITGISVGIKGGAGNGLSDNRKVKIAFPIELKQPVIIAGFPATLTQKFKFLVETGFSAKNGNLSAKGTWAVDGPLGFDGTSLTTPSITPKDKLVDTLAGVSVGINSVVVAISFEFGLQVGLPVAGAGPYARMITSVTLLNGSSIGIVQCRQTTFLLNLKAGVGVSVYSPVAFAIKKLFGYEIPAEKELLTKDVVTFKDYAPKVPVCVL